MIIVWKRPRLPGSPQLLISICIFSKPHLAPRAIHLCHHHHHHHHHHHQSMFNLQSSSSFIHTISSILIIMIIIMTVWRFCQKFDCVCEQARYDIGALGGYSVVRHEKLIQTVKNRPCAATDKFQNNREDRNCWCWNGRHTILKYLMITMNVIDGLSGWWWWQWWARATVAEIVSLAGQQGAGAAAS